MRKLLVTTFVTLDGVTQAPGGPDEDRSGGFAHGGWSVTYWDDVMMETMGAATSIPFAMMLGRKTYEIMAAHWPHAGEKDGAPIFNNAAKYVASTTLKPSSLTWQNSTLLEGDVPQAIARLKREDGPEIQVHGSSNLIQTLFRHDLVDELRMWIFPVVIGNGKRLFADGTSPKGLSLVDSKRSTTGVMINTYHPAGAIPIGSFALPDSR